eukprot:1186920-Rhodomonas_salina.1
MPSRCTWYVGSSVARTERFSVTLIFFFVFPAMRENLSLTICPGSPRTSEDTSAMLAFATFVSSTYARSRERHSSHFFQHPCKPTNTTSCAIQPSSTRGNGSG